MGSKASTVSRPRTFSASEEPTNNQMETESTPSAGLPRQRSYSTVASTGIFGHNRNFGGFYLTGVKCPICSKAVIPEDIEVHLVMCLTRPRINYNEDRLKEAKGECVICLEELAEGDVIARLPCLCIYHKPCIDKWFNVNRVCPEHPQ